MISEAAGSKARTSVASAPGSETEKVRSPPFLYASNARRALSTDAGSAGSQVVAVSPAAPRTCITLFISRLLVFGFGLGLDGVLFEPFFFTPYRRLRARQLVSVGAPREHRSGALRLPDPAGSGTA